MKDLAIVCLDQNVISMLARAETPFWVGMRKRMLEAVANGRFLAPVPKETIIETVGCTDETRIAIRDTSMRLSRGAFFKDFFKMSAEETLALARPQMITCPVEVGNWNDAILDKDLVEKTRHELAAWKKTAEEQVAKLKDPTPTEGFTYKKFYDAMRLSRAQDFFKQLERLLTGQRPDPNSMFTYLCDYLERERITPAELESIRQAVLNRVWESIPLLFFHNQLSAVAEQQISTGGKTKCNPRRYRANDEWDRSRLSIGLAYCNLVITENSLAASIRQHGLDQVLETEVLGVSEEQLIVNALDEIEAPENGSSTCTAR